MTNLERTILALLGLTAVSCTTPGTRPHDMSAAHHDEAAGAEDEAAASHAADHDPAATAPFRCGPATVTLALAGPCWSADVNPTETHRAEAERHRSAAAAHRAAASALRDVEASACAGIPDEDRDQSPFSHVEDIASVSELTIAPEATSDPTGIGSGMGSPRVVGATVVIRAVPGLTVEWLQRLLDCHLARNAVLGHDVPEMAYCPLVPNGVTASVRSVSGGFAVDLRAESDDAAAEVVRRARALVP